MQIMNDSATSMHTEWHLECTSFLVRKGLNRSTIAVHTNQRVVQAL
jgi:hypothetical protein